MKILRYFIITAVTAVMICGDADGQKKSPEEDIITASRIENHLSFLASPLLRGRMNGEPELEIAQEYIVSQVKMMGLKPANGQDYYQPYAIVKNTMHPDRTAIHVINEKNDTVSIRKPVYQLLPTGPSNFSVEGEVIFAGYGLKNDKYGYNDFENLNAEGKILLVMSGVPKTDDGKKYLFEGVDWSSFMSIQVKLLAMIGSKAKAVIIVMDPKSGYTSFEQQYPGISGELNSAKSLKGQKPVSFQLPTLTKILYADRSVADELLKGTGYNLENLQKKIDSELKPFSFSITGKKVRITEAVREEEIILNNVAAYIEGSDPVLRNEYVIFSGHIDHLGASGDRINAGADDNASGCAGLLSIAQAFSSLEKKPLRSVLFLWVSGEEIGLFGSQSYLNNPLVPIEKTIADLNMDMIGRIKSPADTTSETPMTGPGEVFVIACNQSKDLLAIAGEVDKMTILNFDYSLSPRNHPLQLFSRSDHYNFVRKDIPVLFFTTGLHTDYHTPGDVIEKIDFKKMELITRAIFRIGYNVADRKTRIIVDNPFSKW